MNTVMIRHFYRLPFFLTAIPKKDYNNNRRTHISAMRRITITRNQYALNIERNTAMPWIHRLAGPALALCLVFSGCTSQPVQNITSSTAVLQPVENEEIPAENTRKEWLKSFLNGSSSQQEEEENPGTALPQETPSEEAQSSASSSESASSQPVSPEETLTVPDTTTAVSSSTPAPVSSQPESSTPAQSESTPATSVRYDDELRGIWISYLDFDTLLKKQSASAFQKNIESAFDQIAALGLNTVFVQVRPYGDALYPSEIFPWSHTVTGEEGVTPGFDPLEIMVDAAHSRGLRIEAWINPYRIRNANTTAELCSSNPAAAFLAQGSDAVLQYGSLISYNPASETARQLIVDGVKEIVRNYDVDGIHFDDYFYPTTDAAFDSVNYRSYQNAGGTLSLAQWRRQNVDLLIKACYKAIKSIDSSVSFGVSPQGNNDNNLNKQYVDVSTWLSNAGYVDYICPQIYFGFQNSTAPYAQTVEMWNDMVRIPSVKLYIGLAAYKLGNEDTWAGDGKREWIGTTDILSRMVVTGRQASSYGGFVLFRYDSVFPASGAGKQLSAECSNLSELLNG